jgi:hypothetical protein
MKSITAQLKAKVEELIANLKENGLEFTGLYVEETANFTNIAIMYEDSDGNENGDIWEIQGDELEIVEYGAFDTTPIYNWPGSFEEISLDELEVK